ncbi:DUF1446 domain-containing protein [Pseudonocardiaceae bacterium YIM PH 21723]|nr:DUF1446 domain-containing protein [Pseudonocardiaceae bacterium YIM PH 21723]
MSVLRIGNASGYYGDRLGAVHEMLTGGELDVLTGDYLAELTMLILGRDQLKDAKLGYAKTFVRQLENSLGTALEKGVKIVANAGGLNPAGLVEAIREVAKGIGLDPKIGHVLGDDLRPRAKDLGFGDVLTANAYLGCWGIARCLNAGADVVVTGRVTDASLVVGPAAAHFGWGREDYNQLAGATVAGHVLECGTQATGGNFAFFHELDLSKPLGFPLAEISEDGSSVITKHDGTGGAVTVETVTAQLIYEVGNPAYLGPDVTSHFDSVKLTQQGPDRVHISPAVGSQPPETAKVCLNTLGGFKASITFIVVGLDIEAKAAWFQRQLEAEFGPEGLTFELARTDREDADTEETASALLHLTLRTADFNRAKKFKRVVAEIPLASYPGFAFTGGLGDAGPYGICTSQFIPQAELQHQAVLPDGSTVDIAPTAVSAESAPFALSAETAPLWTDNGPTKRVPLGTILGARSGDKGSDANLGVWARNPEAYRWLKSYLDEKKLAELLPETAGLEVTRYELPHINAVNFMITGILDGGVAASARFDPQAKALGEWLRARHADIPEVLL